MNFYPQFLKYLINTRTSLSECIERAEQYMTIYKGTRFETPKKEVLIAIHDAAKSILDYNVKNSNIKPPNHEADLYYAMRGFFMLGYQPKLTYVEIISILRKEGASNHSLSMAGALIGAHLGLKELMSEGVTITRELRTQINNALQRDIALYYIK